MNPYIKDIRDLFFLKNHLEYEKQQMEESNVSKDFFEYESVCNWLLEINSRIANWEFEKNI